MDPRMSRLGVAHFYRKCAGQFVHDELAHPKTHISDPELYIIECFRCKYGPTPF